MCDGVAQGASAAADVAAIRAQARAETIPVVIFLPGILGSELRKGSKSLWGDLGIPRGLDEDIAYDEGIKLDVRLLERFSAWLMALKNIYGTTFAGISAAAALKGSNAWAFPYDWRQSNRTSAKELTEFLCKLSPELKKRPILFYAHSMGGLVLKNWLKHEYRDRKLCPATQITVVDALGRIDGMVFVGTPHSPMPLGWRMNQVAEVSETRLVKKLLLSVFERVWRHLSQPIRIAARPDGVFPRSES